MKLSELDKDKLNQLSDDLLTRLVFGSYSDSGESADAALLLGSMPEFCPERARAAAELYLASRVRYIVASGGVEWEHSDGRRLCEAEHLRELLVARGVPDGAIITEKEALTTKENMIYGTLQINRALKLKNVRRVCIVTSENHLRRSMALAKTLMPRCLCLFGYAASDGPRSREHWGEYPEARKALLREARLLKGLVDDGIIDDFEI